MLGLPITRMLMLNSIVSTRMPHNNVLSRSQS